MSFHETFTSVSSILKNIGSDLNEKDYDGIIVKKLESSNTLDKGRTTKQSHIAITGSQMDMFPYVRADGYFEVDYNQEDPELKKFFVAQIPVYLHKENVSYLDSDKVIFTEEEKLVYISIVRSRRNGAADQIQMSMTYMDSSEYVNYRRLVHAGSYLILLKRNSKLLYDMYSVKPEDISYNDISLSSYNNCFEKLPTNTIVHLDEYLRSDNQIDDKEEINKRKLNYTQDFDSEEVFSYNLYGIRIKEKNTALSENNPHVCIGWSSMGDLRELKDKDSLKKQYDITYGDVNTTKRGKHIGELNRFINEAKIGDFFLLIESSFFHIGRITSDYYFDEEEYSDQYYDYKNTRKIRWIKTNISRETVSSALNYEFNSHKRLTIWNMSDFKSVVKDILKNQYINHDLQDYIGETETIPFETGLSCDLKRNRILFGAPGTGKSFAVEKEKNELLKDENSMNFERVTFHPDYSYANFVGTYKPTMIRKDDNESKIAYEYVPGPFIRILVKALKNAINSTPKPYLLIIEEINRANVAAVFGDVFQLLDRNADNVSEYAISTSADMRAYLADQLDVDESQVETIKIPDNMFIWATMNSADQGVYPLDTAFKRRWDFSYLGINDAVETFSDRIKNRRYRLGEGDEAREVTWNDLREAINDCLSSESYNINEDKLLGPYFVSKKILESEDDKVFIDVFKNKVLMYLFEDAVKQKRKTFFEECSDKSNAVRYSEICKLFDSKGIFIFPKEISNRFEPKVEAGE